MRRFILLAVVGMAVFGCSSGISDGDSPISKSAVNQLLDQNEKLMKQNAELNKEVQNRFIVINKSTSVHSVDKGYVYYKININDKDPTYITVFIDSTCWKEEKIGYRLPESCRK